MSDNIPLSELGIPISISENKLRNIINNKLSVFLPLRTAVKNIEINIRSAILELFIIQDDFIELQADVYFSGKYAKSIIKIPFKSELKINSRLSLVCEKGMPEIQIRELDLAFKKPLEIEGKILKFGSPAFIEERIIRLLQDQKASFSKLINQKLNSEVNGLIEKYGSQKFQFSLYKNRTIAVQYITKRMSWHPILLKGKLTFYLSLFVRIFLDNIELKNLKGPSAIVQCGERREPELDIKLLLPFTKIEEELTAIAFNIQSDKRIQLDDIHIEALENHRLLAKVTFNGDYEGNLEMELKINNDMGATSIQVVGMDVDLNSKILESLFALARKSIKRNVEERINRLLSAYHQKLKDEIKRWLNEPKPGFEISVDGDKQEFEYAIHLREAGILLNLNSRLFKELEIHRIS